MDGLELLAVGALWVWIIGVAGLGIFAIWKLRNIRRAELAEPEKKVRK